MKKLNFKILIPVFIFIGIISAVIEYKITKVALENLLGKEVKAETVIWTMITTDKLGKK